MPRKERKNQRVVLANLKKRLIVIGALITVLAAGSGLIARVRSGITSPTSPAREPGRPTASGVQTASGVHTSPSGQITPASLSPSSPGKEYVYVGGRLVATEEPSCTCSSIGISPSSQSFTSAGGTGGFSVTVSPSTCCWTAVSNVPWISVTSGAAGTGNGSVAYSVGANHTNSCRSGTITVGSQTFLIKQAGYVAADSDCDGVPDSVEPGEGLNPNLKDNDVFNSARLFVMQQYRDILGREGDSGGITYWATSITGGTPRAALIDAFLRSSEFDNSAGAVNRLYSAYFLRRPDYGGMQFWLMSYRLGTPLSSISNAFAASQEFQTRYGNLNNTEFVTLVYNNVLNRPPDPGGLAFWVGQLDSGAMTRGQVMLGFSESAEYKNLMVNKVYVEQAYMCMLRRSAVESTEYTVWVAQLSGSPPAPTTNLINTLMNLTEYRNRFLP